MGLVNGGAGGDLVGLDRYLAGFMAGAVDGFFDLEVPQVFSGLVLRWFSSDPRVYGFLLQQIYAIATKPMIVPLVRNGRPFVRSESTLGDCSVAVELDR